MRATQHFALLLVIGYCLAGIPQANAGTSEKLQAFAKTLGYVRFFHPSESASRVDWNQMSLYAANEVLKSPDSESVEGLMTRLFDPLVTQLEFYRGDKKPNPSTQSLPVEDVIAWQHIGFGLSDQSQGLYRSVRTNRWRTPAKPRAAFGNLLQSLDARPYRGKEIRFRFQAKVTERPARLQGWLRVDRVGGQAGLFDNMQDRPITKADWQESELSGTVDDDATRMTFGFMLLGNGIGMLDDVTMEFKEDEEWKTVPIRNPDFESSSESLEGWILTTPAYRATANANDVVSGEYSARLASPNRSQGSMVYRDGGIMNLVPELGEHVDAKISNELRLRMPLVLSSNAETAIDEESQDFIRRVGSFATERADVLAVANVASIWSAMQHFYPYFDQVDTDWNASLGVAMDRAVNADNREACTATLQWLVAQLDDGHGRLVDPQSFSNARALPVSFGWVEDRLVVIASDTDALRIGDVITQFNGAEAEEKLADAEELISGSPQWKRYRSTSELAIVQGSEPIALTIDREGVSSTISVTPRSIRQPPPQPEKREVVDTLIKGDADGSGTVFYVDLGRAEPKDVDPMIDRFANAKGIVFDLRGYPRGTQYLFQHMTDQHMQSAKWLVPRQIRPDRVQIDDYDRRGRWQMPPRTPRFRGRMVFLTNGSAISYAESCMAIVAHYQLGEIIGSPTAGANGNINPFNIAGGYRVIYTGMRVVNHDDSQHHVLGVQPTLPMEPTLQGIRDGRDELLEKALQLIQDEA